MTQTTPLDTQNTSAVFADHYSRVYRYILSLVHDSTEAEDLTQETFLRAYQRQDSLRNSQAFTCGGHLVDLPVIWQECQSFPDQNGAARNVAALYV